jgi:hypothetical protein
MDLDAYYQHQRDEEQARQIQFKGASDNHQGSSSGSGGGGLVGLGILLLLGGLLFPPLLPFGIILIAIQMGVFSLAVVINLVMVLLRICIKILVVILWIPIGIIKIFIPWIR